MASLSPQGWSRMQSASHGLPRTSWRWSPLTLPRTTPSSWTSLTTSTKLCPESSRTFVQSSTHSLETELGTDRDGRCCLTDPWDCPQHCPYLGGMGWVGEGSDRAWENASGVTTLCHCCCKCFKTYQLRSWLSALRLGSNTASRCVKNPQLFSKYISRGECSS